MDRWRGRTALVTGAASGMGRCIARRLLSQGLNVVAADMNEASAEAVGAGITSGGELMAVRCDVTKEEEVLAVFAKVKVSKLEGVDILINCAGLGIGGKLSDGATSDWEKMLNVNVLGLSICTREALRSMRERGVDDGHIVHIASDMAYYVIPTLAFYGATKWAVRALTEGLRQELASEKSGIRVTEICPGVTRTNFAAVQYQDAGIAPTYYSKWPHLLTEDVAAAVEFALAAPKHVQVHDIQVNPIAQPESPH